MIGVGGGSVRVTPADARVGLDHVRLLSLTRVREMGLLWRKLSGHAPLVSGKSEHAARKYKQLTALGAYQAGFFPRSGARGLLLSRIDELLFSCLEEQWSTAVDVFVCRGAAGEELRSRWISLTGDVFLSIRLAQWARHNGHDAALISEPYRSDNIMMGARYRLSDTGRAIKLHGLGEIARGAPLPVWGVTAYDPLAPWVVVEEDAGRQRLQKLGERSVQEAEG